CEFSSKDIFDWNGLRGQPLRIYLGMGSYARVLWRLGVIPPNLRAQLPDNHRPEEGPALLPELSEAEIRASTGAWLTEVSCTKDGRLALCGTLRCDVLLFPLPGDGPDFLGIEHRGAIARISPDGRTIASAVDEDWMISEAGDGRFQFRLEGHDNAVLSITFSPDGTRLASCRKRELMVRDLLQREPVLRQVDDDLFAVAFLGTDQLVTC